MKKFIFPLLLAGCAFGSSALAQSPQSNIVIILADDLGYGDVSYNGCPDYQTPNIDSIASNGILCTNGYVTHPYCSPSRAGLLTGRYQHRFGHEENPAGDDTNPRRGLYPQGASNPPPEHLAAGTDRATNQIRPLNAFGDYDPVTGKIVMISVGMSNTTDEFSRFVTMARADPTKNSQLVIVDGARGETHFHLRSGGFVGHPPDIPR